MKSISKYLEVPKIGEGIYFTNDVAEILKLRYHKVQYLMNSFWHGFTFGDKRNKAINFFALIEFYTYYHLREKGFRSSEIKKFHTKLKNNLKTPYPFASVRVLTPENKTDKSKIWYEYMGYVMKGDGKHHPTIRSFVEPFLNHIEFGDDLLAKRFYPLGKEKNVVVDPLRQFGKPIIIGEGVRTEVLYRFHLGGESSDNISKLYNLTKQQVEDAIYFHQKKAA